MTSRRLPSVGTATLVAVALALPTAATNATSPSPPPDASTAGCVVAEEPNDDVVDAVRLPATESCAVAKHVESDQDLYLWTVGPEDAGRRLTLALSGIVGQATTLQVHRVELGPAGEVLSSEELAGADAGPGEPVAITGLLWAPGEYVVGVGASGAGPYRLDITGEEAPAGGAPRVADPPNDVVEQATPVAGAFELSALGGGVAAWYAWDVESAPAMRWQLDLQVPVGTGAELTLAASDGTALLSRRVGSDGVVSVPDLGLASGRYLVSVTGGDPSAPHLLTASTVDVADTAAGGAVEIEPNDTAATATPIPVGSDSDVRVISGRLATRADGDDGDQYLLDVDSTAADRNTDVKVFWRGGSTRQVCLLDATEAELECAESTDAVVFNDVVLPEGSYYLTVDGPPAPDDGYLVRVEVTAAATTGFEAEPNERRELASPMAPIDDGFASAGRLTGRSGDPDTDNFRFVTAGEPQLWEITASGVGVERLDALAAIGFSSVTGSQVDGEHVITDLFLLPGEHVVGVLGSTGDYTIEAVPLGPPDPLGEQEPNDNSDRSQAIRLDQTRTGRLVLPDDVDYYRFSLRNETHVVLEVVPADGGQVQLRLARGSESLGGTRSSEGGDPARYDAVLPPGDYTMALSAIVAAPGRYGVTVIPTDPYRTPDDAEPNNSPDVARPLPMDWTISGAIDPGDPYGDADWYAVPAQEAGTMSIDVTGDGAWIEVKTAVSAENAETTLVPVAGLQEGEYTVEIPAGVVTLLGVGGAGDYSIVVTPVAGLPADAVRPSPDGDLALEWVDCEQPVAAYWPTAQQIECTLVLANDAPESVDVELQATTGDYSWTVDFADSAPTVAGRSTVAIDATITVGPDAWADDTVLVAALASGDRGVQSATTAIVPERDAVALAPQPADPVDTAMVGGLDVASTGLGAVVVADEAAAPSELLLHDGLTPLNGGWTADVAALPVPLTVDLAGEQPVPVAGITLDPRASNVGGGNQLRQFELLLSTDGTTWTSALSGELLAVPAEQSFALEQPVDAAFARLVVISAQSPASTEVVLGEWTVVADPSWTPPPSVAGVMSSGGLDIGSPDRGGHVVSIQPGFGVPADFQSMLTMDGARTAGTAGAGDRVDIVVGFAHDRAALLDTLTWTDPPDSDPTTQLTQVTVAVSTAGPVGPWVPVGVWTLDRSAGAVAPFELPAATWARFVRLSAVVGEPLDGDGSTAATTVAEAEEPVQWELPDHVGFVEHVVADDYLSILGAWGVGRQTGLFERQALAGGLALDDDAGDTADTATPLVIGAEVTDTAWVGRDEDWYQLTMPPGQSILELTVGGVNSVDVEVTVFAADGSPVDVARQLTGAGNSIRLRAIVEPGADYLVRVVEPPTSVVFAFDTSLSIGPYASAVYQGVARYAGDVVPGQEAANVLPFGASMLLPTWSDEPYLIQAAINNDPQTATSSDAEGALIESMREFVDRPGAHAVVLVTDAQTSPSIEQLDELWPLFSVTRPRIFAVHVAGGTQADQDLMEDWASVNDGGYVYVTDQGAMDVAFDRAATQLRRPSTYTLVAATDVAPPPTTTTTTTTTVAPEPSTIPPTTIPPAPGQLAVPAFPPATGGGTVVAGPGSAAVAIVLDTSGSMLQQLDDGSGRRIDAARGALGTLVTQTLPAGTNVSLRVFGSVPDSCETSLLVPQSPLDPTAMAAVVGQVPVVDGVRTPIGAALSLAGSDLGTAPGPKIIVLVTDGEETCGGDPAAAIQALVDSGIDVRVNIVGFAVDDESLRVQFQDWARLGNGQYIDAADQGQLTAAMTVAVQPTFSVLDAAGIVVASGQAGAPAVSLPPGRYVVVVQSSPEVRVEVEVLPGALVTVPIN